MTTIFTEKQKGLTEQNKENYNAVDLAKLICAALVVAIHVAPLGLSDNSVISSVNYALQNWLSRLAVPFFFVASGFFLYRKNSLEEFSLKPTGAYIIKLLKLYAVWTLIYFPFKIKMLVESGEGLIHCIFVYFRDLVFKGSYVQLWYFPALIFSVALVSFLLSKRVKPNVIVAVAAFFYVLGLLAQSWFGIIKPIREKAPEIWSVLKLVQKIIVTTRDGLFEGFLFVAIGAAIAFYGFKIKRKAALAGFIISYLLMLAEAFVVWYFDLTRGTDMYIFLVPLSYFAFGLAVSCRLPGRADIYRLLRQMSSLVFYLHLICKGVIIRAFAIIGIDIEGTGFIFVLTLLLSLAASYVVIRLSETRHLRWLKKCF